MWLFTCLDRVLVGLKGAAERMSWEQVHKKQTDRSKKKRAFTLDRQNLSMELPFVQTGQLGKKKL